MYAFDPQETTNWKNGDKNIYVLKKAWSEPSVTWNSPWNSSGGDVGNPLATVQYSSYDIWEEFPVTEVIKNIVENGAVNNGFLIEMVLYPGFAKYRSSEYSEVNKRPKLVVTFDDINTDVINTDYRIPQADEYIVTSYSIKGEKINSVKLRDPAKIRNIQSTFACGIHFITIAVPGGKIVAKKHVLIQ